MENIKIDITINGEKSTLNENLIKQIKSFFTDNIICKKDIYGIKTKGDILRYHDIDICEFDKSCENLTKQEIAFRYLILAIKALNDGWKPNFNNPSQSKYYNSFQIYNGLFVFDATNYTYWVMCVPSALYLQDEKTAKYCKDNFFELYKEYYEI